MLRVSASHFDSGVHHAVNLPATYADGRAAVSAAFGVDDRFLKLYYLTSHTLPTRTKINDQTSYDLYRWQFRYGRELPLFVYEAVPISPSASASAADAHVKSNSSANTTSPAPTDRFPHLFIDTAAANRASNAQRHNLSPDSDSSPPASPRAAARAQQTNACFARDQHRCVLTGSTHSLRAVHILPCAESQRMLEPADGPLPPCLRRFFLECFVAADGRLRERLPLPLPTNWDNPKLALTMRSDLEPLWADGRIWCDEKGVVQFSAAFPGLPESALRAKQLTAPAPDTSSYQLWPPAAVFELHRAFAQILRARPPKS